MNTSFGKLFIVIGLPGAGKSWLISNQLRQKISGLCVHDFHGNAFDHSSLVTKSRHYVAVLEALKAGHDCVIADIEFCRPTRRDIVARTFQAELPGLEINYHCLRNQPDRCRKNVLKRNRKNANEECGKIVELSKEYVLPPGATEYEVTECAALEKGD